MNTEHGKKAGETCPIDVRKIAHRDMFDLVSDKKKHIATNYAMNISEIACRHDIMTKITQAFEFYRINDEYTCVLPKPTGYTHVQSFLINNPIKKTDFSR